MAPSLLDLSQRILVWILGILAMLGSLGNAVQGILDGRLYHFALWFLVAVVSVAAAVQAENLKAFLEARNK